MTRSTLNLALNRLAKWRSVLAGWQLGTRSDHDGETRAVRDHREQSLLMRAEVTALTALLIGKGIFTVEEFAAQLVTEADLLDRAYARKFPGFTTTDDGVTIDTAKAADTMRRLDFPA